MGGWAAAAQAAAELGTMGMQAWMGHEAQQAQKLAMKKRYQWTVKDLQKAGLNPMMAFGMGNVSPPSTPTPPVAQLKAPNLLGAMQSAKMSDAQLDNLRAQTQNTDADTTLKQTQEKEVNYRANLAELEWDQKWETYGNTSSRIAAEAEKAETDAQIALKQLDAAEINNKILQGNLEIQELEKIRRQYDNEMLKLGMPERRADAQYWETFEGWGKAGGLSKAAIDAYKAYIMSKKGK